MSLKILISDEQNNDLKSFLMFNNIKLTSDHNTLYFIKGRVNPLIMVVRFIKNKGDINKLYLLYF